MRLSDWPSLRLVLPLAGGILLSDTISDTASVVQVCHAILVPSLFVLLVSFVSGRRLAHMYGIGIVLCFFILGCLSYGDYAMKVHVEWPDSPMVHSGVLVEWPQEKARSCRLDIEIADSTGAGRRIIMYVPKDSAAFAAIPGQQVCFYGRIRNPSNSDSIDFDYAGYLYRHGISGTLWVPAGKWCTLVRTERRVPLRTAAMILRHRMIGKLQEWGLEGNALAVTAAVSLGEKRILDDSLRQIYSNAGASHVLAVSGLHVGILFWLLGTLIPYSLFPYRVRWSRDVLIIAVMWIYAFMIGLPLSITRSLVMFSMLSVCRAAGRDSSSVNSLAFAALVILVLQPQGLFDMGFQLSFSAVLAILLFEPDIHGLLAPKTSAGNYFWGIVAVSLAAQLGTAPLVAFHFGSFSTWFLLANLTVIPLMFVTVCLSMLIWALGWFEPTRIAVVEMLDAVISLENCILEHISSLPHSVLELDVNSGADVWTIYALMLFIWLWIKESDAHRLVQGLLSAAVISLLSMVQLFAF